MKTKKPHPRPSHPRRNASIIGTGAYLPKQILTNDDLAKRVETSDEWITSRTGIKERRIAAPDELTSDLGAHAAREALREAKMDPKEVDLIIVATCTPDTVFPSTACHIQHKIGATNAAAFDLQAACSGFLYAMIVAEQFIATRVYETVLVVGAEKLSSVVNWEDRNTCVLFGDGAGAVVMQNREGSHGLLATDMGSDGAQTDILSLPSNNGHFPLTKEAPQQKQSFLQMSGKEVYRYAVNAMNQSAERCLELSGLSISDISLLIPHQANLRIISAVADRMKLPMEKCYINLDRYGNTSAACIPIALHEASRDGKLKQGDHLLLIAFGGGLTWASAVLEW